MKPYKQIQIKNRKIETFIHRRKYPNSFYSWVSFKDLDGNIEHIPDPWPCSMPSINSVKLALSCFGFPVEMKQKDFDKVASKGFFTANKEYVTLV